MAGGTFPSGSTGLGYSLDEPLGVEGTPTSHAWLPRDFSTLPCHGCIWARSFSKAGVGACRDGEGCESDLESGIWRAYQLQKRH